MSHSSGTGRLSFGRAPLSPLKIHFIKRIFFLAVLCLCAAEGFGQAALLPVSNRNPDKWLYEPGNRAVHPAMQQVVLDSAIRDSLIQRRVDVNEWQTKNWFFRKLFTEHLVEVRGDGFGVNFDFLPDMWIGKQDDRTLWNNTREIALEGFIGKKFSFSANVTENQGVYPLYVDEYIRANRVIPGMGNAAKTYGKNGFDFSNASANLSFTPSRYINIQAGFGKNFIGNGYRSLLLSDFAFSYPYLKLTGTLGRVQYTAMWTQFIDMYDTIYDDETPFPKKYGLFHYLDWSVNDRLNLGLFENVMWAPRGGEFTYAVPILFLHSAQYNNGSPDKLLVGLNGSYKLSKGFTAYGQLAVNEFTLKEVFGGDGYWANKFGGQIGVRAFDLFKVNGLNLTAEYNTVRPYTYSASQRIKNYGHYNEPLAHPMGANFREGLLIANYNYNRWQFGFQGNAAMYGADKNGLNYGKNIFLDYTSRVDDYGVKIGHGLRTTYFYGTASVGFLLNPKNNLRLEAAYTMRDEKNAVVHKQDGFVTLGLRASFRNVYRDF